MKFLICQNDNTEYKCKCKRKINGILYCSTTITVLKKKFKCKIDLLKKKKELEERIRIPSSNKELLINNLIDEVKIIEKQLDNREYIGEEIIEIKTRPYTKKQMKKLLKNSICN
jgi:hypothetical protein